MKTILIPTDFSKIAHHTMNYATEFFKEDAVNYILLNAFSVSSEMGSSFDEEKAQHQLRLDEEVAYLKGKVNEASVVTSLLWMGKINYLPKEILVDNSVDLVLMGTKGIDEVEKYLGKSNAGEFVAHVDANALIVPADLPYVAPQNVLFTTDFRNFKEDKTIASLKWILDKFDANLFILYVNNSGMELTHYQNDVKKRLHEAFVGYKVSFHEFLAENIEDEIQDFMEQYNIDIVSAIPMHNTFFDRIFHKSLSRTLAEHATKPVLMLTNKNEG